MSDHKKLAGHHLMRVRIRKVIFSKLQEVAEEESERLGAHVTVSDLVRSACFQLLLTHESLRRLENAPLDYFNDEDDDEDLRLIMHPMLD